MTIVDAPERSDLMRLSHLGRQLKVSPLQAALAAANDPKILSVALGMPDPQLFPTKALSDACERVLSRSPAVLQYSAPCATLREEIVRHMARRGVRCSADEVVLTHGATQGLHLLLRVLLDPGQLVFEEELTYPTFRQMLDLYRPSVVTIPSSATTGIDVEAIERALESHGRPAFLYCVTDGHNPLGINLSVEKRERLARLAREWHFPIIEDDAYGYVTYGTPVLPIRALEPEWVCYVGTFSKILAPSLRLGWVIVPRTLAVSLSVAKETCDINTGTFAQWVASEFLQTDALPAHISHLCAEYRVRRDAMNAALVESFLPRCSWVVPDSGLFYWVDLPEHIDTTSVLVRAIQEKGVAFMPGEVFSRSRRRNGMRLNFTGHSVDEIREAVRRIGSVLHTP